jgi:hypothetical protein
MAVKTNPRFIEALMLGANHEMGARCSGRDNGQPQRVQEILAAP